MDERETNTKVTRKDLQFIAVIQCKIAAQRYTQPMKWRYTGGLDCFSRTVNIVLLKTVIGPEQK